MRTNIIIDDELIEKAMQLSGIKTKKEVVNVAIQEFVKNIEKRSLLDLRGKIKFRTHYDYTTLRRN